MHKQVFISYCHADLTHAEQIIKELEVHQISYWFDKKELLPGHKWQIEIKHAIENTSFFLAILSENGMRNAGFRHNEIKQALIIARNLPPDEIFIIPVRIDCCNIPYDELKDIHIVDLFKDRENGMKSIIKAIKKYSEKGISIDVKDENPIVGEYENFIDQTYRKYLNLVRRDSSINYLYQQAGKVYDAIKKENINRGFWQDYEKHDNTLVYYIAGWIKNNVDNYWIDEMTQKQVASGITDLILLYLKSGRPENIFDKER